MTILPKNFAGAKKSHRKQSSSQAPEHTSSNSKAHIKKPLLTPVTERGDRPDRIEQRPPPPTYRWVQETAPSKPPQQPQPEEAPNSDDEYGPGFKDDELEAAFVEKMKSLRGFDVKVVQGDGACMFRAVADQIYGDEEMHHDVRRLCMDYIAKNRDHFSQFVTEDFNEYVERKRSADAHGNHVELQAISDIFLRPIEIFEYDTQPITNFDPITREPNNRQHENPPIRLSYHGSVHYNSVVDPYAPTVGVGLGLPGYVPGLADQNLVNEAKKASERHHIEEAMLKDKLKMTDWERTEEELQRQVATESYMDYIRQIERETGQTKPPNDRQASRSPNRSSPSTHASRSSLPKPKAVPSQTDLNPSVVKTAASSKFSLLGSKRGASSPNLPCTSREDEQNSTTSVPMAKIHRNENSVSMPNIGELFGSSLNEPSNQLLKPSTSTSPQKPSNQPSTSAKFSEQVVVDDGSKAGTSKETQDEPPSRPSMGLYEELLATTTAYGEWDESEDTALLAVIAQSQQDYLDQLKKSPRQ